MDAKTLRDRAETFTYNDSYINGMALEEAMMEAAEIVSPYIKTGFDGGPILGRAPVDIAALWTEIENVQHNFPDLFEGDQR